MKRILSIILTLSVFLGVDAQVIVDGGDTIATMSDIRSVYPSATSFKPDGKGIYSIKDGKTTVGKIVLSDKYVKEQGFAGPTPLLIAFGMDGKVIDVVLLKNEETPGFVKKVKRTGLFSQWNGLSQSEATGKSVDAVSGATFTSNAVINTLRATLSAAKLRFDEPKEAEKKVETQKTEDHTNGYTPAAVDSVAEPSDVAVDTASCIAVGEAIDEDGGNEEVVEVSSSVPTSVIVKNVVITIMAILSLVLYFRPKQTRKLRRWFLLASVIVLGFWQSAMLSVAQFIGWMHAGLPLKMQWGMLVMAAAAIIVPLFFKKKYYCIYVCPFGAAQELVGLANKKKVKISDAVLRVLIIIRKAIFVAVVLTVILGVNFQIGEYEPFALFNIDPHDLEAVPLVAVGIALVSLIASIFISRPWCRFVCPLGQGLDLMK